MAIEGIEVARVWHCADESFAAELRLLTRIMRFWPGGVSISAATSYLDEWLLQENLQRRLLLRGRALKVEAEKEAAVACKAAKATAASAGAGVSSPAASSNDSAAKNESNLAKEFAESKKDNDKLQKKLEAAKSSGAKAAAPKPPGGGNGRGQGNGGGRGKGKGKGKNVASPKSHADGRAIGGEGFQTVTRKKNKKK